MNKTKKTIDSYNKSADRYAEKFMEFESYKEKVLYFQSEYAKEIKTIIDLGCGPGNVAKILYEKNSGYDITGIDLSEKMVRLATQNVPNGKFYVGDLRGINLTNQYEAAIASFAIVHLTDEETKRFLERVSNLIGDDGYLYLSFMEGGDSGYETSSFSESEIFYNYYKREEIIRLLEVYALRPVEVLEENYVEPDGSITKDIFVISKKISS